MANDWLLSSQPGRNFDWNFSTITVKKVEKKRETAGIAYKNNGGYGHFMEK